MRYLLCAYNFNGMDGLYLDTYTETNSAEVAVQTWFQLQVDHEACVDLNTEKKESQSASAPVTMAVNFHLQVTGSTLKKGPLTKNIR